MDQTFLQVTFVSSCPHQEILNTRDVMLTLFMFQTAMKTMEVPGLVTVMMNKFTGEPAGVCSSLVKEQCVTFLFRIRVYRLPL